MNQLDTCQCQHLRLSFGIYHGCLHGEKHVRVSMGDVAYLIQRQIRLLAQVQLFILCGVWRIPMSGEPLFQNGGRLFG